MPVATLLKSRMEAPALDRLAARGLVMLAGTTPSDAAHVLGDLAAWDDGAARKALDILRRTRTGTAARRAADAEGFAQAIIDQLTAQTTHCLLEAAFAEDPAFADDAAALARHPLTQAGLGRHRGIVEITARIGVPVIGLGASAPNYYRAVGARLGCRMVLPEHAGVANAIGAVVGQITERASGTISSQGAGRFTAHLETGPAQFADPEAALAALEAALTQEARARANRAGAGHVSISSTCDIREAEIEGSPVFIEATMTVTAAGRPGIAEAR